MVFHTPYRVYRFKNFKKSQNEKFFFIHRMTCTIVAYMYHWLFHLRVFLLLVVAGARDRFLPSGPAGGKSATPYMYMYCLSKLGVSKRIALKIVTFSQLLIRQLLYIQVKARCFLSPKRITGVIPVIACHNS